MANSSKRSLSWYRINIHAKQAFCHWPTPRTTLNRGTEEYNEIGWPLLLLLDEGGGGGDKLRDSNFPTLALQYRPEASILCVVLYVWRKKNTLLILIKPSFKWFWLHITTSQIPVWNIRLPVQKMCIASSKSIQLVAADTETLSCGFHTMEQFHPAQGTGQRMQTELLPQSVKPRTGTMYHRC